MPRAASSSLTNETQYLADSLDETIIQLEKLKVAVLQSGPGPDRQELCKVVGRQLVSWSSYP